MPAPTFVAYYESGWNQSIPAGPFTCTANSVVTQVGDILVVFAASANDAVDWSSGATVSGGSLSYTLQEEQGAFTGICAVAVWTATATANTTFNVSVADTTSGADSLAGICVYVFRDSDGIGDTAIAQSAVSEQPDVDVVTTQANSAVVCLNADWAAADGASRAWLAINSVTPTSGNGLEKEYFRDASHYTVYSAYWDNVGAIGTKTTGLASGAGPVNWVIIGVEVKGTPTAPVPEPYKVADRASLNSNTGGTTFDYVLTGLTPGNLLIIRTAADNAGTNGVASTVAVTNQSGTAIDTATDQAYQATVDPGAANAGSTCNVIVALITATSGTVRLTYGNTVVQAGVAEEWAGIDSRTTLGVIGTPQTATGTASTTLAAPAEASVASGNLVYAVDSVEGPSTDTYTQDADTTNGSWTSLTKVGTTLAAGASQTTAGAYKVVSATGAQTYNPTNSAARDSAGIIIEFARAKATPPQVLQHPVRRVAHILGR